MMPKTSIVAVTDTALWVAALRAQETERSDAAFKDRLAARLAGERGAAIARSMPNSAITRWGVVVRTSAIDRLIEDAMRRGIECVVNLGAGLDTRPYRMKIPPHIRWIEIDFPDLIQSKDAALEGQTPICHLERIGLNLLDCARRKKLFAAYGSRRTLMIAEGVVPYLSNDDVASLADDLHANSQSWILDFDNAGIRSTPRGWARPLEAAPMLFQPIDWFGFFENCGWHAQQVITSAEESERLNRPYPPSFPRGLLMHALPRAVRQRILGVSGAALLGTAAISRPATTHAHRIKRADRSARLCRKVRTPPASPSAG
jgi:methyltransferase (TIGR00027 family)